MWLEMDFRSTEVNQYLTLIVSKVVAIDIQEDKMSEHQPCRRAFSSLYWLAFMAVFCISGSGSVSASIANNKCMQAGSGIRIDNHIKSIYKQNPIIPITHVDLVGDRLEVFLAALNRNPPRSQYKADRAVVFISPSDPRAMVVLGKSNCVINISSFPVSATLYWMRGRVVKITPNPSKNSEAPGSRRVLS